MGTEFEKEAAVFQQHCLFLKVFGPQHRGILIMRVYSVSPVIFFCWSLEIAPVGV